jgi:hypothetical protein
MHMVMVPVFIRTVVRGYLLTGGDAGLGHLSPQLVGICWKRAANFPQPSFRDSPFLYPVFVIIAGVLKTPIYRAPLLTAVFASETILLGFLYGYRRTIGFPTRIIRYSTTVKVQYYTGIIWRFQFQE